MISLKKRAVVLRRNGWSYKIIAKRLGVSKSSLSLWLRDVPYEPNRAVIERIRLGPARAAASKGRRRLTQILALRAQGQRDLGRLSRRDLLLLGLGLYLGEGSKVDESVRIVNADPLVIRIAMRWLRQSCGVPERNFVVTAHIYPDLSSVTSVRYWSRVTGVPPRQFEPVQIDRRLNKSAKKRRRLPYGTAHIKVYSRGNPRFGVALHRRIMGWLHAVQEPVAGVV